MKVQSVRTVLQRLPLQSHTVRYIRYSYTKDSANDPYQDFASIALYTTRSETRYYSEEYNTKNEDHIPYRRDAKRVLYEQDRDRSIRRRGTTVP